MFKNKIVLAVDKNNFNEAWELCNELKNDVGLFKLGLEFFYSFGAEGVNKIASLGVPIFLDLKLHDIPNTVSKAVYSLIKSIDKIDIITLHASGGAEMLEGAREFAVKASLEFKKQQPSLAGVTVLTSSASEGIGEGERVMFPFALGASRGITRIKKLAADGKDITVPIEKLKLMVQTANNTLNYWLRLYKEEEERIKELNKNIFINEPLVKSLNLKLKCCVGSFEFYKKNIWEGAVNEVLMLASNASTAKIPYIVCSPLEVKPVKSLFPNLKIITPGVRPNWYNTKDDQSRVLTPKEAVTLGSDLLVIGRPIAENSNPKEAVRKILEEIS